MKVKNGKLWFQSKDLEAYLGLTTGQVTGARQRDKVKAKQFTSNGSYYYEPGHIIGLKKEIEEKGTLGGGNLRKTPDPDQDTKEYKKICRMLKRYGYTPYHELQEQKSQPQSSQSKKKPKLPFSFDIGSGTHESEEFFVEMNLQNIKECFGFADETNDECKNNCAFYDMCLKKRPEILGSITKLVEEGKNLDEIIDNDAVREVQKRAFNQLTKQVQ